MKFVIQEKPQSSFLKKNSHIHEIAACLLWQRGIRTKKEIDEFLNPTYRKEINGDNEYDPFKFKEMEKVVKRITDAARKKERVVVYGDYDADGVCSSVLLIAALEKLYGIKQEREDSEKSEKVISVYLPHREEEGYGLTMRAVDYLKNLHATLVITCDCGTGNIAELQALKGAGIDVIVLDHHLAPRARPPAYGFINPKYEKESYPFRELAGCGVVFKVVQGLRDYLQKTSSRPLLGEAFEKWSLDLVALATVADMMPLRKENRILVKWGLFVMNKLRRPGIRALAASARLKSEISAYDIGFILAPRINAAGRIDHANAAYDLLREPHYGDAFKDAEALAKTNEKRKKITEEIFQQARAQTEIQYKNNDKILVAHNFEKGAWQTGILGLVAGKLVKEFGRPAFVIGKSAHGLAGSGRSITGFDITALAGSASHLFEKSGGHKQACGFTFITGASEKKLAAEFKKAAEVYADKHLSGMDLSPVVAVDLEIPFSEISWRLVEQLEHFEPYGQENAEPRFLTRAVMIESARLVGANNDHLKFSLSHSGATHQAICFSCGDQVKKLVRGDVCDVVYTIQINEWRGEKTIQLMIKELDIAKN